MQVDGSERAAWLHGILHIQEGDLEETELSEYKSLDPRWHEWDVVKAACSHVATVIFDRVCDLQADPSNGDRMEP